MKNEKVVGIYQRGGVSCDHTDDRIFYVARDLFLHYSDHPRPDCRLLGNADDRQLTLSEVSRRTSLTEITEIETTISG